jgi:hypothetical protein
MADPLLFVRYQRGVVGETRRTTHLAGIPDEGAGELIALCGEHLVREQAEQLTAMDGTPCTLCLLRSPGPDDPAAKRIPEGPRPRLVPGLFHNSA